MLSYFNFKDPTQRVNLSKVLNTMFFHSKLPIQKLQDPDTVFSESKNSVNQSKNQSFSDLQVRFLSY